MAADSSRFTPWNAPNWERLTIKQRAARMMSYWARLTREFSKLRCRSCGGQYPCDDHNIEP